MPDQTVPVAVQQVLTELVESGQVPGIIVAVAAQERPVEYLAIGVDGAGRSITRDSYFPIASISKLATALTVLRLVERGELALDDPLITYIPQALSASHNITIRMLLSHTSGLPLDVSQSLAPYEPGLTWQTLGEACILTDLEAPPMTRVQYSNVGYGLLGLIVEECCNMPFSQALSELVLKPLGIDAYLGDEPPRTPAIIADVRGRLRGSDWEAFNSRFWRSLAMPWGGMVSTVDGALKILQAFQGRPGDFLQPKTRAEAMTSQTNNLPGGFTKPLMWNECAWGLGLDLRGNKSPHWVPASAGAHSYGHSGASGALAWTAPDRDLAWVILGARAADTGWLLRRGPTICQAILDSY
jgi:beta-lactamase class C